MNTLFIWIFVFIGIALFFIIMRFLYLQYNYTMKNYHKYPKKNPTHWGWQLVTIFTKKE